MNHYPCELVRAIDGDTLKLRVDLGFRMSFEDSFRLIDINTAEMNTEEGEFAKLWVESAIESLPGEMTVKSKKHGKYRWLGEIFFGEVSLNELIKLEGLG